MGVRVWGVVDERLIELRAGPCESFRIVGLPDERMRTTEDRVRAAMLNSGLVSEAPGAAIHVRPPLDAGPTADLDLPIALAGLAFGDVFGEKLRWVVASGRLGLDGSIKAADLPGRVTLADVVSSCQTPVVAYERTFEGESDG
jgi:predicted ATPase with chaperone activity